ncbi:MAG: hypothetical protein MUO78_05510, partial [candidate division Zixibacteria bacterium]|nr:hypothetical protein [candidate division Zixibacteria bacterium]
MLKRTKLIFTGMALILYFNLFLNLSSVFSRTKETGVILEPSSSLQKPLAEPCVEQRTHRVAKYCFTLTNWGYIGSQFRTQNESRGGCFNPYPNEDI